jgi:ribulose-phosphate 3-epimerase
MSALPGGNQVAPSILSADFARLGSQVEEVLDAGAKVIHVDVMDGDFVPPITIGPLIVSAVADLVHDAGAVIDVHLMIERPERQVDDFAKAGADSITAHAEATSHIHRLVGQIKEAGCGAGVAINPGTPVESLAEVASTADLLLCMTVNPGWGGQAFIPEALDKVRAARDEIDARGLACEIEIDGGINLDTAPRALAAGADILVAGSAVFGAADPRAAAAELRRVRAAA